MLRFVARRSLLLSGVCAALVTAACGGAPTDPSPGGGGAGDPRARPPGPIPPTGPLPGPPCAYTLDEYRERVAGEDSIPEWEAIDCFTKDLARLPIPAFVKRYNMAQDESLAMQPREGQRQWEHYSRGSLNPATNLSSGMMSGIPPSFDLARQKVYEYPLSPAHLERKLRGVAPFFLSDKRKGLRTVFVQFYPPGTKVAAVTDVASYKRWITEHLVPEKIAEAKYAERLKFEAYVPFPAEVEIMIHTLPFVTDIPVVERVQLAQWVSDTLLAAVRPHFHGHLLATSYTRYEVTGREWEQLSFKGWDSVAFGVFPECDLGTTKSYMASQLASAMKVVERSGGIPWSSGEVFVKRQHFLHPGCLTEAEFFAEEPKIYRAIIDAIEAAPTKPVGFLVDHYLVTNPASFEVIESYWNSKPN